MSQNLVTKMVLETAEFNRNIVNAQNSLKRLQKSGNLASNGIGKLQKALVGIGSVATLKSIGDTIREMSRMQTALKNVSGSAAVFSQHMNYITTVANRYGANISTLTREYTKFIAAGKSSELTLDQQKNLFESVVQASTALSLSQDDMSGALLDRKSVV